MAQLFGLARLGRDCEIRYTAGGEAVANLSLAFSWGKKGEDGRRNTSWVEGSLWGKRAEALAPHLLKGGAIAVTLEDVHIETYQGKNGEGHKLVGRVTNVELAGGGQQQAASARQGGTQPRQQGAATRPAPAQRPASSGFDDMDDSDPPF